MATARSNPQEFNVFKKLINLSKISIYLLNKAKSFYGKCSKTTKQTYQIPQPSNQNPLLTNYGKKNTFIITSRISIYFLVIYLNSISVITEDDHWAFKNLTFVSHSFNSLKLNH